MADDLPDDWHDEETSEDIARDRAADDDDAPVSHDESSSEPGDDFAIPIPADSTAPATRLDTFSHDTTGSEILPRSPDVAADSAGIEASAAPGESLSSPATFDGIDLSRGGERVANHEHILAGSSPTLVRPFDPEAAVAVSEQALERASRPATDDPPRGPDAAILWPPLLRDAQDDTANFDFPRPAPMSGNVLIEVRVSLTSEAIERIAAGAIRTAAEFSRSEMLAVASKLDRLADEVKAREQQRRVLWGR